MFTKLATLGLFLSLLSSADARWSLGRCSKPSLQSSFDLSQYVGTWYEIARDKNIPFEYGDCVQARYALESNGHISVHNSQLNPNTLAIDSAYADAKCSGAQCNIKFFLTYSGDYRVLSTDYSSYSIVYSCNNYLFARNEYVWVLARSQSLTTSELAAAEAIITSNTNYDVNDFYYTVQGGACTYLS